jgi:hypothetical protein
MANTLLTPTAVTREALRIAHEKLAFIGSVNRQYDDSYAKTGAKIGDSLKIRLPNEYNVRTGAVISAYDDTTESSVTVQMATQKGVDVNFSSTELTLSLDDFSTRILKPAISKLVSVIESDMFTSVTREVYNQVGTAGTTPSTLGVALAARAKMNQFLTPKDDMRALQYESGAMAATVDNLKGLFNDSNKISEQYREGLMGRTAGFDWYENERVYSHTNSAGVVTGITSNGATQSGSAITVNTTTTAYAAGTIVTFAGVFAVHPETKVAYPFLKQFVVTSATATVLTISPALVATGATQNASTTVANASAVTVVSGAASTTYQQSLAYHKDAFTFVTADLEDVSQYGSWGAREVMDGLSLRIARQYDIVNDKFPCRIDILHGYKAIRPQFACRVTG